MSVTVEKIAWGGWQNCYRVANGEVELIVTADVGPRIIRYAFLGGQNLLKEYPEQLGKSGEPVWQLRGGHRIWIAPEDEVLTYQPDNDPVDVQVTADGVIATGRVEAVTGIEKQIAVALAPTGSRVRITHRLRNTLAWPLDLAPWALTMMAQGGAQITGYPPRGTHPEMLAPTHPLILWAFTDMRDPRYTFLQKYFVLRQDPANAAPTKLGHFNENTWGAYLLGNELFLKRTAAIAGLRYPDLGCSYETFTRDDMLEMETLGAIRKVAPGEAAEQVEDWSLHHGVSLSEWTDAALDRLFEGIL